MSDTLPELRNVLIRGNWWSVAVDGSWAHPLVSGGADDPPDPADDPPDPDGDPPDPKGGTLSLTQAELDRIIDARLARDRRQRERQPKDDPKPDPKDKKDDGDDDLRALKEELAELRREREQERLTSAAEKLARTPDVGAKSDRAASVVRLADLDGLTPADTEDIQEALLAVLDEYPEWRKSDDDDQPVRRRPRRSTRDDTTDRPAPSQSKASKADPGLPRLIAAYEESSKAG